MDANRLVFGSDKSPTEPIILRAGPLTMEFSSETGSLRYIELPDGTEAIRAVYPSLRGPDWSTLNAAVSHLRLKQAEESFSIAFNLAYELDYSAKVTIEGSADGIVYSYSGVAEVSFNTSRTGLCVLHPANMADQPVEIRHSDGSRESGRFPDLVQPDWPFREVVGVSTKLPGYKVEVTMEGEVFEMEDQRNFGDASFKTYCRPQSRPFPYEIGVGDKVTQTVRITAKPWGSKVEGLPPMPDGVAGLMFIEETLPVPLIGLVAEENPRLDAVRAAPVDYIRMPAKAAKDVGLPVELFLDLSSNAEEEIAQALAAIQALPQAPDRLILSPVGAAKHVKTLKERLEDVLVMVGSSALVDLNRSPLKPEDADGVAFGFQPQAHLIDDQTLFENLEALPDLAATAAERTEGPVIVGPVRLGSKPDARTDSLLFASWLVAALSWAMRSDVDAVTLFDLEGPDGLFRDGRPIPAYHVLYDLQEFADGELVIGIGTARRAAGFALVLDEDFRAIVANLTPMPLRLSMVAAGDAPHFVKVLDGQSVERAITEPTAWRAEAGEAVEPSEGIIEFELGPYGVARIDAEVDNLETNSEDEG